MIARPIRRSTATALAFIATSMPPTARRAPPAPPPPSTRPGSASAASSSGASAQPVADRDPARPLAGDHRPISGMVTSDPMPKARIIRPSIGLVDAEVGLERGDLRRPAAHDIAVGEEERRDGGALARHHAARASGYRSRQVSTSMMAGPQRREPCCARRQASPPRCRAGRRPKASITANGAAVLELAPVGRHRHPPGPRRHRPLHRGVVERMRGDPGLRIDPAGPEQQQVGPHRLDRRQHPAAERRADPPVDLAADRHQPHRRVLDQRRRDRRRMGDDGDARTVSRSAQASVVLPASMKTVIPGSTSRASAAPERRLAAGAIRARALTGPRAGVAGSAPP